MAWTNPTQITGLAVYGAAAAACLMRWRSATSRRDDRARFWRGLAIFHGLFFVDILLDVRLRAHDALGTWLIAQKHYQLSLEIVLAIAVPILAVLLARKLKLRTAATGLAFAGTVLSTMLYLVEFVSWHYSDRVIYHPVGPIMVIAVGWIVASLVVIAASRMSRGPAT